MLVVHNVNFPGSRASSVPPFPRASPTDEAAKVQTQELFWRVLLLRLPIVDPVCYRSSAMQCPAP